MDKKPFSGPTANHFFPDTVHRFIRRTSLLETRISYTFRDPALLERALTRKAFANGQRRKNNSCNDQEIFRTPGDSVLILALKELLIHLDTATRDEITQKMKEMEREETLARIGRSMDLGKEIRLGDGE